MFEQTFVEGTARPRSHGRFSFAFAVEIIAIGILILIPLIYTDTLPQSAAHQLS